MTDLALACGCGSVDLTAATAGADRNASHQEHRGTGQATIPRCLPAVSDSASRLRLASRYQAWQLKPALSSFLLVGVNAGRKTPIY